MNRSRSISCQQPSLGTKKKRPQLSLHAQDAIKKWQQMELHRHSISTLIAKLVQLNRARRRDDDC